MHNLEESDANYERNYLDSNEELKKLAKENISFRFWLI